jgi:hypothetical protein
MSEIVYILTNPVIPDLVKVGRTNSLEERVRSLSAHSGVPVPFEVYYACVVKDSVKVEKHIHEGFGDHRVNPKREFFRINPERVLAILKLVEEQDITQAETLSRTLKNNSRSTRNVQGGRTSRSRQSVSLLGRRFTLFETRASQ